MFRFDLAAWIWLLCSVFSLYKGYQYYLAREGTGAVGCALAASCALIPLAGRIRSLYYLHLSFKKIDRMSGAAFERYLSQQFRSMGYRVRFTESSHDYGADLVLIKRRERIVVQAKRYEKNVGIAAVQEVVGSIAFYEADRAMVVTNSGFTKSAWSLARQNEVELWDREEIRKRFHIKD